MKRSDAISHAEQHFDTGEFRRTLARRIAVPTESQNPERAPALADYLESEMRPAFEAMGFTCQTLMELLREGLRVMAGLYWDLGAGGTPATSA